MALPISTPLNVTPDDLFQRFVDRMRTRRPDWEPADGSPDVWMAEAFADITADAMQGANETALTDLFRWYGANITGLPPIDAVAATGTVTITGTAGYVVPAGSTIAVATLDPGRLAGFETLVDATLTAGTAAGVGIVSTDTEDGPGHGAAGNDLTGPAQMVDSLADVASVTLDAPTSDGSDAEEDEAYIDRLVAEEQLRTVSPILPRDFAQLAKRVLEVDRAAYLDGYDTADGSSGNALMVTLVPVQADGSDVSASATTAVVNQFAEDGATPALVGFVVNVTDPYRSGVSVTFAATARDGFDAADVETRAEDAVAAFLDPQDWGQPLTGERRRFDVQSEVLLGALYSVLYAVEGLQAVTSLTVGQAALSDDFSTDTIVSGDWLFDVGAGTSTISGGVLHPSSTAQKSMYRNVLFGDVQVTRKITLAGTVTSGSWSVQFKRLDATTFLTVRIDEAAGQIAIRKDGTTDLATASYATPTSVPVWLRALIVGNAVTGEVWTTDPALGGSPAATVSHTLAGADATAYGTGVFGSVGQRTAPASTSETYDDFEAVGPQLAADLLLPVSQADPVPMPYAGTVAGTVT